MVTEGQTASQGLPSCPTIGKRALRSCPQQRGFLTSQCKSAAPPAPWNCCSTSDKVTLPHVIPAVLSHEGWQHLGNACLPPKRQTSSEALENNLQAIGEQGYKGLVVHPARQSKVGSEMVGSNVGAPKAS